MSELKAILATPHPKMKNACDGAIEVYPKSEADKALAEKDTKIIQLKALIENYKRISGEIIDNANHQKYKRCLARAKWCGICAQFQHNIVMQFDNPFYIKRAEWSEKWKNRWLKIAEKFKEVGHYSVPVPEELTEDNIFTIKQ